MYQTSQFEEKRAEVMHQLICAHPLATLVTLAGEGLTANHIPFEIDPHPAPFGTLRGHVARANPIWRDHSAAHGALAVFQGPQIYVTPSWYATKKDSGKVVPTWNYAVVHAQGPLRVIDDAAWLRDFLETLTNRHEGKRATPWKVSDAPGDYIARMLQEIVGIEIPIASLVGKWKVSQNRPAADREGVALGLEGSEGESAAAMGLLVRQAMKR